VARARACRVLDRGAGDIHPQIAAAGAPQPHLQPVAVRAAAAQGLELFGDVSAVVDVDDIHEAAPFDLGRRSAAKARERPVDVAQHPVLDQDGRRGTLIEQTLGLQPCAGIGGSAMDAL
jgi:hypothetical protein